MTKKEIYDILNNLIVNISEKYDIKFKMDYGINIGNGETPNTLNNKKVKIKIGIKELKNRFFSKEVDDILLTKGIVCIYHELQHYIQMTEYFNQTKVIDTDNLYMLTNFIACIGNYDGYYNPDNGSYNYWRNPREINAEYEGIVNTYEYLSVLYDEDKAKGMILDYINSKTGNYFIPVRDENGNCINKSLNDIDSAFKLAYEQSKQIKRLYNTDYINIDKSFIYGQELDSNFVEDFLQVNNPIQQDRLLTGLYLQNLNLHLDNQIESQFITVRVIKPECINEADEFISNIKNIKNNKENNYDL